MKSFQTIYTNIQNQTFDSTATTLTLYKQWINDSIHKRTNDPRAMVFLEKETTATTQAGVQFLPLPYDFGKLIRTSVTVGSTLYSPAEAPSKQFWDRLNYIQYQSQVPYFFYIQANGQTQKLGFYPTPSTDGNTITYYYQLKAKDLTKDDYTTGSIYNTTTTAAGVTTVTGSTTGAGAVSWNSGMVGQWIQLQSSTTAPGIMGDNYWYQIASVPTTNTLTLTQSYGGTTIATSATPYTIAEFSVIPDGYEDIIEEDVLARHFRRIQDFKAAAEHETIANARFEQLIADKSAKTNSPYSAPQVDLTIPNINSFPSNLTGF